jgi:hypothetical protein
MVPRGPAARAVPAVSSISVVVAVPMVVTVPVVTGGSIGLGLVGPVGGEIGRVVGDVTGRGRQRERRPPVRVGGGLVEGTAGAGELEARRPQRRGWPGPPAWCARRCQRGW